jgi:molecular chaperone DnaK
LVHMKFFNMVNDQEESIGDLWLGIDDETIIKYWKNIDRADESAVLSVEITLKIDENNLVSVAASLRELPDVHLRKTLSRGRADEKLFRKLESMINDANEKKYNTYAIDDMTTRIVSTIEDIHHVIDPATGQVVEPVYNLAELKIDKTRRFTENNISCYATIYFAEEALDNFAITLSPGEKALLQEKIAHLKQMNITGSYEENLAAYEDLDKFLDTFPVIIILMKITKARDLCDEHDPARAGKFHDALPKVMKAILRQDDQQINAILDDIMPEVGDVLKKYDYQTRTIPKEITR